MILTDPFNLAGIMKLFLLTLIVFYFIFTLVVYRQIQLMTKILDSQISPWVKVVAILQIIVVGFLFLVTMVIA